jgi:hypothetical protein
MAVRTRFRIGIHPARSRFVQIILTAIIANIGGKIANHHDSIVSLQSHGCDARMGLSGFANSAFHFLIFS